MWVGWVRWGGLSARVRAWLDRVTWVAARGAVDAVRYQPRHLDLVVVACGTSQPELSPSVARWLVETRAQPAVVRASRLPHAAVRAIARQAARWFGPTGSALVRFFSGAIAAAADHAGSLAIETRLRARVHPGLLVPHPHAVAVLALDMRGFSKLTGALEDTQYLAQLIEVYLTELTEVVEHHRGVVFQYTGDGLLALFLPELAGVDGPALLDRLVNETSPAPGQGGPATLAEAVPASGDPEAVSRRRGPAQRLTRPASCEPSRLPSARRRRDPAGCGSSRRSCAPLPGRRDRRADDPRGSGAPRRAARRRRPVPRSARRCAA